MRYGVFLFLFIFLISATQAQISREQYILRYQILAIEEMGRSGIPASIKMAQALLESNNGNSQLAHKSNNHFGIKCKSNWTGQKVYHNDDEPNECFRKYRTVEDSYIDHSNFLMGNPRYAFLFTLPPNDYKRWAEGLKDAGYATAKHYAKSLIKIIEDNQLYLLDTKQTLSPMLANATKAQINNMSEKIAINPFFARTTINVNNLKAVAAKEGDTFEILAQSFAKEPWELYNFNDLPAGYRPQPNEVIYLEPKRNKSPRGVDYHKVSEGETMHFISQMYGLKLKRLLRRNRMKPGEQPIPGDWIYLRTKKPAN
ncbi:MAG: LysM peptidoglycan-binding domain-containing protein [Bacteroidales bacterium]|jgi:hypothetical protein|nr:LysM peptidoglycan-binding domain-containing protein [Bacteroidales bacterium]